MLKFGVNVVLAITFASGLAMLALVTVAGDLIVRILFGASYASTDQYLSLFALTWIPWALAQAILIRITASASRLGVIILAIAAAAQYIGAMVVLPDVARMMIVNGSVGLFAFLAMYLLHVIAGRRLAAAAIASAER
jgi:O-antigen/teichoic acid export membrane protein